MSTHKDKRNIQVLKDYQILDTPPEDEYDNITELAAYITDCPISLISFLKGDRQFFKSHHGLDISEIPLSESLCAEVVFKPDQLFMVEDIRKDAKYNNNPLKAEVPDIVFYAGVPLISPSGIPMGSLCVVDRKPKSLDKKQIFSLQSLAHQVIQLLELRRTKLEKDKQFIELQNETKRVKNIIESTGVGTWEWNVQTDEFQVNERWAGILGYSRKELEPITIDTWYKLVNPEDIPYSDLKLNECLEGRLDFYNVECRMKHKEGHYVWINDRGRVIEWSADGKPMLMTGMHTDITERKIRETQFNIISNNVPGVVFRYKLHPDGKDELQLVTKGAYKLWGVSAEQAIENNQLVWERYHPDDLMQHRASIKKSASELSFWENEWRYCHPDGSIRWHQGAGNPLQMEDGSMIWDSIIIDITETKETQEKLDLALTNLNERLKEQSCLYQIANLSIQNYGIDDLLKKTVKILPFGWQFPERTGAIIKFDNKVFKSNNYKKSKLKEEVVRKSMDGKQLEITIFLQLTEDQSGDGFLEEEFALLENIANHLILYINQTISRNHLEASKRKFQSLVHTIDGIVWEANAETLEFTYISPQVESILGYSPEEWLSIPNFWQDIIHPEDREGAIEFCRSQVEAGNDHRFQYRVICADGKVAWVNDMAVLIKETGSSTRLRGILVDITKQKMTEEKANIAQSKMKKSEQKYRTLFNSSPLPKWIYDVKNYHLVAANDTALDFFHFNEKQFISQSMKDLMPVENWTRFKNIQQKRLFNDGPVRFGIFTLVTQIGKEKKMDLSGHFLLFEGRKCALIVGLDVTENEKNIQLLKDANQRFKYVNKATNDAIYDWNVVEDILYWGESFDRIFGYQISNKKTSVKIWEDLIHPEDLGRVIDSLESFIRDPNQLRLFMEYRFKRKDGSYAYIEEIGYAIRGDNGHAVRMIGVLRDVSQRKKEEQQLRLLESVVTQAKDSIMITEAEPISKPGPRIVYVNEAFTKMTGYTAEEIIGKTPRVLQGPRTDKSELKKLKTALKNWQPCEITVINYKKNGEEFWINFSVSPVADQSGWYTHWISIERDVTHQKNLELERKLISEISGIFAVDCRLNECLDTTLSHLVDYSKFSLAEIWLINWNSTKIHRVSKFAHNAAAELFYKSEGEISDFVPGEGLPGEVWESNSILVWDQVHENSKFPRALPALKSGIKSAMGLPLKFDGKVIGVLFFGSIKSKSKMQYFGNVFEKIGNVLGTEIHRKKLEEELNNIFSTATDIICLTDSDGNFIRLNDATFKLLEYSREELRTKTLRDITHPADKRDFEKLLSQLLLKEENIYFENRIVTRTEKTLWIDWSLTITPDENLVYAVGKDITEKKEIQKLLDSATQLSRVGSWEMDLINQTAYWSEMTKEIYEVPPEYQPGIESALDFYPDEVRGEMVKLSEEAIGKAESWDLEYPIKTYKGNERWVRIICQPEFRDGQCIRLYGSFQDIHQRKIAELNLQKAYRERNSILESIGDGFFAVDADWVVTYWNHLAESIFNRKRENVLGEPLWSILVDYENYFFYSQLQKALKAKKYLFFEEFISDLNIWLEVSVYPSEEGLSVFFKNVNLRKKAEERIRQTNERFQKVTQATNDAIWDWDIESDKIYWGEGFNVLFGHNETILAPTLDSWKQLIHPEDRDRVDRSLFQVLKDHSTEKFFQEYQFQRSDGQYAYVVDRGLVIRNEQGKAIRMVGAMSDITYRKEYEESLENLNSELQKHSRELEISNAELEQFAYVASHDLQEPLRMVTGFMGHLQKKYGDQLDEKANQYIHFAVDGAQRMRQIILDLLEYSRVGRIDEEREIIDLNELIADYRLLRRKILQDKSAVINAPDLPVIEGYRSPITQIFHNLLDNALKYTEKGVKPKISIVCMDEEYNWEFRIEDNGIGIEGEYYDKIFILFQRLHDREQYSGTGIGLAVVKKIIDNLGGEIWVDSTPGKGSTFYFKIPKYNTIKDAEII